MSDQLRKVQTGEPLRFPARFYNALVEMAAAWQGGQFAQGMPALGNRPADGIVLVHNDSGADRDQFQVLGVKETLILPGSNEQEFKNRLAFKADTPSEDDHLGRFVILAEPIKNSLIGRAWAFGVCPVKVDVGDAAHRFADVADGVCTSLKSGGTGGATILWKESGTGLKWALVRFDCAPGTAEDPAVLEPEDFEQETAATDEWDITDPPAGKDGVTVRVQTRTAYNDAGDQKLYAFYRDLTFDSRGCLVAATGETRVEIDAPEDCVGS
jgi:hypothetical protein